MRTARLEMLRGLRTAFLRGLIGGFTPFLLSIVYWACRCLFSDFTEFERWDELQYVLKMMTMPIIGFAWVCGCAGWATSAPVGNFRFAPSLAIVAMASIFSWLILGPLLTSSDRLKGVESPTDDLYGIALMMGPPFASAALLGAFRGFRPNHDFAVGDSPDE